LVWSDQKVRCLAMANSVEMAFFNKPFERGDTVLRYCSMELAERKRS
jgi:hypothetical protein